MLAGLGFLASEPSIPAWLDALELVKDAPSYPLIPAEWFEENPRQVASGYVQLDQLTRTYRQARDTLAGFSEEAVLRLNTEALKTLKTLLVTDETCLLPHDHTTVLTLRSHLQGVAAPLLTLTDRAKTTNRALEGVLEVLGLKPCPLAHVWGPST